MDGHLDQHEDDGTEAGRSGRCHSETSEDGTKTFALVPTPLYVGSTGNGDTNTSDGRDERVRRRDVSGVLGAPLHVEVEVSVCFMCNSYKDTYHNPHGGTSESTSERKHLNTGVALEGIGGDNAVLDGLSGTGTDGDGTDHLEDGTQNHGLAVGDRAGRHRGSPCVGNIV